VPQRISSLKRLCVVSKQFADESVLQRMSSLMRLCGASNKFADQSVLNSVYQFLDEFLRSRESVRLRVCASVN
jgi:hypothetical protein